MAKPDHEYMDTGALTEDSVPETPPVADSSEPHDASEPDTIVPEGVQIN